MIEVAIVGGGVSGLALARALQRAGREVHLFEARAHLGGRVESVACQTAATRVDLGPTWYWPHAQPLMAGLVQELSLQAFPQHDPGDVVVLDTPDATARRFQTEGLHGRGHRLAGGMASLVEALVADLPASRIHCERVLGAVRRTPEGVELRFEHAGETRVVAARRIVLALPPRLIAERVRFEPALPQSLDDTLCATPTWMASQAKAVLEFDDARWRTAGHSGNAFVQHDQATLKEVFDACEAEHGLSALGGFLALSPDDRQRFRLGLPMLLASQAAQLFGHELEARSQHYRDWSAEPFCCSDQDRREHSAAPSHGNGAPAALQQAHWDGRLLFAGSETADRETGYLEGALRAAVRTLHILAALPVPEVNAAPRAFASRRRVESSALARGETP